MDYLSEVVECIKPLLKGYGFKKKELNWYFENENIVKVLNIQKSLYGKQVYINIGICIKALEDSIGYLIYKCQIQDRLDHIIGQEILDFENSIDIKERCKAFQELVSSNPYKFMTLEGTVDELKEFLKETGTHAIFKNAKEFLGLK